MKDRGPDDFTPLESITVFICIGFVLSLLFGVEALSIILGILAVPSFIFLLVKFIKSFSILFKPLIFALGIIMLLIILAGLYLLFSFMLG